MEKKIKSELQQNLFILEEALSSSVEEGYPDPESVLYNRIADLLDDLDGIDSPEEVDALVIQAKEIETLIDAWALSLGKNTIGLMWA